MKEKLHQFYSKIRFKKIRNRFLAAMIVLSIPPLFLLGYLSFNIAKDTLLETNKKNGPGSPKVIQRGGRPHLPQHRQFEPLRYFER